MPLDTRRLPVPDVLFPVSSTPMSTKLDLTGVRGDDRDWDQLRPVFLKRGVISQAKGSAYIEMKRTKLIVAVHGPREIEKREDFSMTGRLHCEFKYATFSCQIRGQHQPNEVEKELSMLLTDYLKPAICLHMYPKSVIEVYVTVLENDGSALAAALISCGVALADAAIEMYDIITAASVLVVGDRQLVDPTEMEENFDTESSGVARGHVTVVLLPQLDQISGVSQRGRLDSNSISKAMQSCIEACRQLFPVVRLALTSHRDLQPCPER